MALKFARKTASALLVWHGDEAWLTNFWVYQKREGQGTELMEQIIEYADKKGIDIWLLPRSYGSVHDYVPTPKLIEFYRRFGFERMVPKGPDIRMFRGARKNYMAPNEKD